MISHSMSGISVSGELKKVIISCLGDQIVNKHPGGPKIGCIIEPSGLRFESLIDPKFRH